jgi:metal-responsive CopG/Arc/MetJ family transcriptional regulator
MTERRKERIQFDFTPEALQRLDEIKKRTGASTRAETVRNALRAYEWLVEELDPDGIIKLCSKDNEEKTTLKAKLLLTPLN